MKRSLDDGANNPLPEGWVMRMSSSKKKPYYVHTATNKTQWHHPNEDKPKKLQRKKCTNAVDIDPTLLSAVARAFRVGGSKTSKQSAVTLFQPWSHQVRAVAKVAAAISSYDPNASTSQSSSFLIQHSTGSGKSFTIACLAYQLLYTQDKRACGFHTVVILVDRIKLDEQLGDTVESFLHQNGIDNVFRADSIEHLSSVVGISLDQKVIVTTTHKLGLLVQDKVLLARLLATASSSSPSTNVYGHVAIIADEVHRSHTSATRDSISTILTAMEDRAPFYIGFSATPSAHTLRLFGTLTKAGFRPFDCHSITDAVAMGHIVNVLDHYTSRRCTYRINVRSTNDDVANDHVDDGFVHMGFASSHDDLLAAKATNMMQHFVPLKAKLVFAKVIRINYTIPHHRSTLTIPTQCLVVARNRKDVVTYHRLLTAFMARQGLPARIYCTFSAFDTVHENQFNKCTLAQADVIVVCDKLDTGFNEPALLALYLDRPLVAHGRIVQLLSRLNRSHVDKTAVYVVDYANHPAHIRRAFCTFHDQATLAIATTTTSDNDVKLDLDTASLILCDTVPGLVFDAHNQWVDETNRASMVDVAEAVRALDKDTYTQIKHAVATYLSASTTLRTDSPVLPRTWVEELKRRVIDGVTTHDDDTCDPTCGCHDRKRAMTIRDIAFETVFQGPLWTHSKYEQLQRLLLGENTSDTLPETRIDHIDAKLQSLWQHRHNE
ncbi:Aste57867_2843 [Aphanomyces stellatus]|uniref:Aste57867_2843 protein n=1 Tax=Aphanomyces stellatus TaxID=120398 RepID=A0A485KA31_9STRA|nr:hypothetical protein As57867_002835 [Aphanomyces stellatus]VFT80030.1 Aste57867_2843 [Aphanomyces stellatus]